MRKKNVRIKWNAVKTKDAVTSAREKSATVRAVQSVLNAKKHVKKNVKWETKKNALWTARQSVKTKI